MNGVRLFGGSRALRVRKKAPKSMRLSLWVLSPCAAEPLASTRKATHASKMPQRLCRLTTGLRARNQLLQLIAGPAGRLGALLEGPADQISRPQSDRQREREDNPAKQNPEG